MTMICSHCKKKEKDDCIHLGRMLHSFGCCGAPPTKIYACAVRDLCTLTENDGLLEWSGKPVVSCLGCPQREA